MSTRKQNILIIGGGGGGIQTAQALSKVLDPSQFSIQLVSDRPFHLHWPALIRAVVTNEGDFAGQAIVPLDRTFQSGKAGEVIIGQVARIEDGVAHLTDDRELPYDYLVLATGTTWSGPLVFPNDVEKKDQWIENWHRKFAEAKSIVIVGGGAVGIEFAGEIKHFYPNKNITLIHAEEYPLNAAYPVKFRKYAAQRIREAGINLILNDRASLPSGSTTSITTEKGVTVEADLVLPAWGGKRNTEFLKSFDPTILTPLGYVHVLPTLQVVLANGKTNVYALGDIIEWNEQKTLSKVAPQVPVVSGNILAQIAGKPATKKYNGFMEVIVIPLGPTGGFAYFPILWGLTFGDWIARLLKSRTLFVEMARKMLNYA